MQSDKQEQSRAQGSRENQRIGRGGSTLTEAGRAIKASKKDPSHCLWGSHPVTASSLRYWQKSGPLGAAPSDISLRCSDPSRESSNMSQNRVWRSNGRSVQLGGSPLLVLPEVRFSIKHLKSISITHQPSSHNRSVDRSSCAKTLLLCEKNWGTLLFCNFPIQVTIWFYSHALNDNHSCKQ